VDGDGKPWVVIKASSTLSALHYMEYMLMSKPIYGMPEVFQHNPSHIAFTLFGELDEATTSMSVPQLSSLKQVRKLEPAAVPLD
jgi:hypothetical protein